MVRSGGGGTRLRCSSEIEQKVRVGALYGLFALSWSNYFLL